MKIQRLKTNEEIRSVEKLTGFFVIVEKKRISEIVKKVTINIPKHLKCVNKHDSDKMKVLVHVVEDNFDRINGPKNISKTIEDVMTDFLEKLGIKTIYSCFVPKHRAVTQKQYQESIGMWPCHYFPIKEHPIENSYVYFFVNKLKCICKSYIGGEFEGFGSDKYNKKDDKNAQNDSNFCSIGCMIVDPKTKKIIYNAADTDNVLGHAILKAVTEVSKMNVSYLCTGLDMFMIKECCSSCAMALIHGRIGRVFFLQKSFNNSESKGSFTDMRLFCKKEFNHKFLVYFCGDE